MIDIEEVGKVHLNPGDVLIVRVSEIPVQGPLLNGVEVLEDHLRRMFPDNKFVITDGTTMFEVMGAPDWDEVTRQVMRRMHEASTRM